MRFVYSQACFWAFTLFQILSIPVPIPHSLMIRTMMTIARRAINVEYCLCVSHGEKYFNIVQLIHFSQNSMH